MNVLFCFVLFCFVLVCRTAESSKWTEEFTQQQRQQQEQQEKSEVDELDLRTLTRKVTQIDDEKLQGTNFMKLMAKLRSFTPFKYF
jgi:hypothetical protein